MPEICRFDGISFRIHPDHPPPHIHVWYSGVDASVEIRGCRINAPGLPPRVARTVREWVLLHEEQLLLAWDRAQNHGPVEKIPPLH